MLEVPRIRHLYTDLDLIRKYKRFRPQRLRLPGSGNMMFVDPNESRGRAILRGFATGQPGLKRLWHNAVVGLRPTLVLDIGLNYGEFLFGETYDEHARLIGIEANAGLQRWIERSRIAHPNSRQIEIIYALASDQPGERSTFYIDRDWSGRSSALLSDGSPGVERREIPSISVDSLLEDRPIENDRLLFKIDVEGFEPLVLRGMRQVIRRAAAAVGFTELNSRFLRRLDVDIDDFLGSLAAAFQVYALDRSDRAFPLPEPRFELLQHACGAADVVTDLVLVSHGTDLSEIGLELANV
jgi:FkbM family methyltransferase